MTRTIRSLVNGEYLYPTVKDIGKLNELKTTVKTDVVSAINDIVNNGVASHDGITEEQVDGKIETATDNMKTQTEADLAEVKNQLNTQITDAQTSLNKDIVDAQNELKEHDDNIQTLNNKAQSLSTDLDSTKTNLDNVKSDLANVKIGQNDISQTLDTVKGQIETKAEKANLDAAQEQIEKNTANILINAEGLDSKATKEDLTLANQNITKVQSDLLQQADEISGKVSEDKLTNKMNDFQVKKANLLLGTRDWYNWVISNPAYVSVTDSLYNACYWASLTKSAETISMNVSGLTSGDTYTLSVVAKTIKSGDTVNVQEKTAGILKTKNNDQNVTTNPQTYSVTFVASSDTTNIAIGMTGSVSSGNALLINEAKLETGSEVTYWEMNSADNFERIEHSEAQQKITSDQISNMTLKQTQIGDKQEEQSASISQLGDKIIVAQNDITTLNGNVKDVNTKIDSKAGELQATFSEEINQQIDNISDSNNNEILNSGFTSKLDRWQTVSAKANIVSDSDNKNWVDFKQSGLSVDSPISIESNYFEAKDNDVIIVAFDLNQLTDVTLDNNNVLILEVFNASNSRVDYKELQISDFEVIGSNPRRLRYKYQISHSDTAKFAIRAELKRNGHLQFSNFLAVKSTINNGAYVTNAQDNVDLTVKQQNQITANTEGLQLKADKTSVDTLSQTVTSQSSQLSVLNDEVAEKTNKTDFDNLTGRVTSAEQKVTANADGLNSTVSKMSTLQDQVNNSAVGTNLISGSTLEKNWYAQSPATASLDAINFVTFTKSTTSSARQGYMHTTQSGFLPSQYYTLSAEIYIVSVSGSGTDNDIHFRSYGSNSAATGNYVALLDTSKVSVWQKLVVTGKTPSDVSGGLDFGLSISGGTTGVFKIRNFKLELGSTATDYSANPADNATVTSVTNVSQKADQIAADLATSNGDITQLKAKATGWDSSIASANGKINTLQATSDGYAVNISTLQDQVNNSAVGSNVLHFTNDYSNFWYDGGNSSYSMTDTIAPNGHSAKKVSITKQATNWSVFGWYKTGLNVDNDLQPSTTYTGSFYILADVDGSLSTANIRIADGASANNICEPATNQDGTFSKNVPKRVTFRMKTLSNWTNKSQFLYIGWMLPVGNYTFWDFKLEKGLTATDYSANPADNATTNYVNNQISATSSTLSANLTSATTTLKSYADNSANNAKNSAISTASSDATTKANNAQNNAIATAKTYADTQISATAGTFNVKTSSIQTQLNNSAVGSNLLVGTGSSAVMTGANTSNQTASFYSLANGYNASKLATVYGTQFTISFDWSVSGTSPSGNITVQWNNVPWGISSVATVSSSNTSGHFSKTFGVGTQTANIANVLGFRLDNFKGTLTVSNVKLEKGSVATDWSLAPTDTDYTNLFSMDSNGITLDAHGVNNGNKTILLRGDHVKIDSNNPVVIPSINANVITSGTMKSKSGNTYFNLDTAQIVLSSNNSIKSNALLYDGGINYQYTNFNGTVVSSSLMLNYASDWNNSHHLPDWLLDYQKTHNLGKVGELNISGSDFINIHAGSTAEFTINNVAEITKNHKYSVGETQMAAVSSWVNKGNISMHIDDDSGVFKISKKTPATGKDQFISLGWYTEKWMGNEGNLPADFEDQNSYTFIASEGIMISHTDTNIPLLAITSPTHTSKDVRIEAQSGDMDIINGVGAINIDAHNGIHMLTSGGRGDGIFGNNDGTGNVGMRGSIFYWDLKENGTRMIYADSSNFNIVNGGFTATAGGSHIRNTQIDNELWVNGVLNVSGAKNAIVKTSKGWAQVNAYETAEYYFGDLGKTNTGSGSKVKVVMDKLFLETVNTNVDYHVFVSSYGNGYAWVSEQGRDYFIIESNVPDLKVGYEIKAKRLGYESNRLEIDKDFEDKFETETTEG
ncbi:hypothetical protein [Liquorilactobacillus hordei]|uniref:hypothetical protein n=1 Tax=Liquorilactobacillus hordei TaxID=468911 RepID=UPI0039E9C057